MIGAAFVVAWGAEAAEFLMSQGLALAMLALIQTLPEFAVEAVIAWKAGKNPDMVHLAIANFTGSLRLLTGFGWPMIYAVAAFYSRKRRGKKLGEITLHDEHAVEVLGLLPPLPYFVIVWAKASLALVDAAVLTATYVAYLAVLLRHARRGRRRSRRTRRSRRSRAGPFPSAAGSAGARSSASSLARRRDHLRGRRAVPALDARARHHARDFPVRLHPVGRAVPLGVPGEDLGVRLGPPDHARAGRADEHGLLEHQPVGRALGDCWPSSTAGATATPRRFRSTSSSGWRSC